MCAKVRLCRWYCDKSIRGQFIESFVLKGKAKTVFKLIELMAIGERANKQQKTKERITNYALENRFSEIMENRQEEFINKTLGVSAAIIFVLLGIVALLTDLNRVGATILVLLGIGGFALVYRSLE